ncbi:MAG: hypothetical protein MZW92_51605 [Comamonadaceae bacterium]|nr:hypothetical protein [Comamonadaceae bacterium]
MNKPDNHRASCAPDPHAQLEKLHDVVEASVDPMGVAVPLAHAQMAWLMHPQELAKTLELPVGGPSGAAGPLLATRPGHGER